LDLGDRRDLIKALLGLLTLPHAPGAAAIAGTAVAGNAPRPARRLEPALLAALVDTLLPQTATPGGLVAGTHDSLQQLMTDWASPQTFAAFASVLATLDSTASREAGRPFAALDPTQRHAVLARFHASQPATSDWVRLYKVVTTIFFLSEAGATQVLTYEHAPGAWQPSIPLTRDTLASAV